MRSKKHLRSNGTIQRKSRLGRGSKPINKVSTKEIERQKQYAEQLKKDQETIQECNRCKGGQNLQRHHVNGRRNILDHVCMCASCHSWIHEKPKEAREEGYLKRLLLAVTIRGRLQLRAMSAALTGRQGTGQGVRLGNN